LQILFTVVGHSLWTLILAVAGGVLASSFRARTGERSG
jgi:hypothetical protein